MPPPTTSLWTHTRTGIQVALDESLDEGGLFAPSVLGGSPLTWRNSAPNPLISRSGPPGNSRSSSFPALSASHRPLLEMVRELGLAAVVVKPSVMGSYEALERLAAWAGKQGAKVITGLLSFIKL